MLHNLKNMRVINIFLLLFLIPTCLFSQRKSFEELKKRMEEESDQDKIESCLDIAELDVPIDTAFYYLDHGLSICKKIGYDTVYQFYFQKGLLYYYDGKFQNAKEIILDGSQFTKNTKNPKAYSGQVNMLLGVFSEALNQQDSALIFYDKTLDLLKGDDSKQGKEIQASTFVN